MLRECVKPKAEVDKTLNMCKNGLALKAVSIVVNFIFLPFQTFSDIFILLILFQHSINYTMYHIFVYEFPVYGGNKEQALIIRREFCAALVIAWAFCQIKASDKTLFSLSDKLKTMNMNAVLVLSKLKK